MYKPLVIENRKIDILSHECSTKSDIPLCCIDAQGIFIHSGGSI